MRCVGDRCSGVAEFRRGGVLGPVQGVSGGVQGVAGVPGAAVHGVLDTGGGVVCCAHDFLLDPADSVFELVGLAVDDV
jgi:hypothetical protein